MKILHTADWHLGRSLHRHSLAAEFEAWCQWVVDTARAEALDAVLISGDVYDRASPSQDSIELLDDTLTELASHTTVVLTSGNHDSAARLGFVSRLMGDRIHIRTRGTEAGTPVIIEAADGECALIYPIPYLDPDIYRRLLAPNEGKDSAGHTDTNLLLDRSHEAVMRAALDLVRRDIEEGEYAGRECARILMAHAFVSGAEASESNRPFHVGGAEAIPASLFRLSDGGGPGPLDYVALGHLHQAQRIGAHDGTLPEIRYSGSPIAFSFGEAGTPKSAVLLTIHGGTVSSELRECPLLHPVARIEGTLGELLSPTYDAYRDSYLDITVTDKERPSRVTEQLRAAFTYPLHISIAAERERLSSRAQRIEGLEPADVFAAFVQETAGRPIQPRERSAFMRAWEETMKEAEK